MKTAVKGTPTVHEMRNMIDMVVSHADSLRTDAFGFGADESNASQPQPQEIHHMNNDSNPSMIFNKALERANAAHAMAIAMATEELRAAYEEKNTVTDTARTIRLSRDQILAIIDALWLMADQTDVQTELYDLLDGLIDGNDDIEDRDVYDFSDC